MKWGAIAYTVSGFHLINYPDIKSDFIRYYSSQDVHLIEFVRPPYRQDNYLLQKNGNWIELYKKDKQPQTNKEQ